MEKPALLLKVTQHLTHKKAPYKRYAATGNAGYTLLELLVVAILVGLIAAISAPGWLSFTSQRRASKAIDGVVSAVQEAQSQAKNKKVSYSVAFRDQNGIPQIAVYRTMDANGNPVDPYASNALTDATWKNLGENLEFKAGQVRLLNNLQSENNGNPPLSDKKIITFDYTGALPRGSGTKVSLPLVVTVGLPDGTNNIVDTTKRCVKISTLLGAMTIGKGTYNVNSNPDGCPYP